MTTGKKKQNNANKTKANENQPLDFDRIGILGRVDSPQVVSTLTLLRNFLLKAGKQVFIDTLTASTIGNQKGKVQVCEQKELCQVVDLLIVVGGDGSLLSAGRLAANYGTPLVGVNRGRLGFLTDVNPQELEKTLKSMMEGNYVVDERFLLEAKVGDEFTGLALNDVVLNSGRAVNMIEFELYIDGRFVYSQLSDGLIISTPTGSTAYALSGGGPIMFPSLDAIVLVPMCPHTLSSRPIVIDGDSEIHIVPSSSSSVTPQIACDGQEYILLKKGSELRVKKSKHRLRLLHPSHHEFYEACRSKLGWGTQL